MKSSLKFRRVYSCVYTSLVLIYVAMTHFGFFNTEHEILAWRLVNALLFLMTLLFFAGVLAFHNRRKAAGKSSLGLIALAFLFAPFGLVVLSLLPDDESVVSE